MARDFAQFKISVWTDPGWTSLTLEQQGFYTMLASQSTINLAGVLDFLPGRLARLAEGLTAKRVRSLVEVLEGAEMVFLDEDTEELLVRAVIRTNGAWKTPNSAQTITSNVEQTMSRKLQSVLMYEIQRTLDEAIEEGKWEKSKAILSGVMATLDRSGINPWSKGSLNPSANPLPGKGEGDGDGYVGKGDGEGAIPRAPRSEYPTQFEEFWSVYPKRADKRTALSAWEKALRRASHEEILEGAARYQDDPNREDAYTKNASTWLNADAWANDLLPARPSGRDQPRNRADDRMDQNRAVIEELRRIEEENADTIQGELL